MHTRLGWAAFAAASVLALVSAFGPASTHADNEELEPRARAIHRGYLLDRRDTSRDALRRRLVALRELAPLRCRYARDALLEVARAGRTLDDRIIATRGVAEYGSRAAVQDLLGILATKGHPVLTQVAGDGLAANTDGSVRTWMAWDAFELPPALVRPVLRAHDRLGLPEAARSLAWRTPTWAASPDTIDLAFHAVRALGRSKSELGQSVLFESATHADFRIRLAVADVVLVRNPHADETAVAVRTLLGDDHRVVRRTMAEGIAVAKVAAFVPDVTHLLDDEDLRTRATAREVLMRLTGRDLGFDRDAWSRWWTEGDTPDDTPPPTLPTYHGVPVDTERMAFVNDRSSSLYQRYAPQIVTRTEVTHRALVQVLNGFSRRTVFNLLAFDTKVDAWRKTAVRADPETIRSAVRWVRKQKAGPDAGTDPYGVLKQTFELNSGIDTIYFLSDGIHEDGEITTTEGILAAIDHWNRYRRVRIHAITLQVLPPRRLPMTARMEGAAAFMARLAATGHGRFQSVGPP